MAKKKGSKALTIIFRIAALALSVAAAVVMGTASQLAVADGGRGHDWSSYTVSYSDYKALVYFVAASAFAAVCSAAGLFLVAVNRKAGAVVAVIDVLAQGFLFSGAGAAFATRGVVGVCDAAGAFCGKVAVAAVLGAFAAVAVALAALASKDGGRSLRGCCDL
ncbi:hypothetical protein EJB05_26186, partial [Eragrostis curvula]